jgi:hypothetical protein
MNDVRVIKLALSSYPSWWRQRYGDEVSVHAADMVTDGRSPATLALSLILGAVRTRWTARGMPKDYHLWSMRNRLSIAGATLTWLLVAPIPAIVLGNQRVGTKLSSVSPYHVPFLLPAAPAARIVTYSTLAMAVVALVTILLLLAGWSHLIGGIERFGGPRRAQSLWLASAPGIAFLVLLAGAVFDWIVLRPSSFAVSGRDHHITYLNGHPAAAHDVGIGLTAIGVVGWLLSIVCIAVVAKRSEIEPSELRFGTGLSTAVAALFALLLGAYVCWGIGLTLEGHQAAHGGFNTITYAHQELWLPMAILLLVAVTVSMASARTARRSWNVLVEGWSQG